MTEDMSLENYPEERRYERWVMRAAEILHGIYPDDKEQAEALLLVRLRSELEDDVTQTECCGESESVAEEGAMCFSGHVEDRIERVRSTVYALCSAAAGNEWSLFIEALEGGKKPTVSIHGVSLDLQNASVDLNTFACRDVFDLRALHGWIFRQLPKRQFMRFEAATEALKYVEEMQAALEVIRCVSDHLDVLEEIRGTHAALQNLWMNFGAIAAMHEPSAKVHRCADRHVPQPSRRRSC